MYHVWLSTSDVSSGAASIEFAPLSSDDQATLLAVAIARLSIQVVRCGCHSTTITPPRHSFRRYRAFQMYSHRLHAFFQGLVRSRCMILKKSGLDEAPSSTCKRAACEWLVSGKRQC